MIVNTIRYYLFICPITGNYKKNHTTGFNQTEVSKDEYYIPSKELLNKYTTGYVL